MSYVKKNLLPNEQIVGSAKIHWFVFLLPAFCALITLTLFLQEKAGSADMWMWITAALIIRSCIIYFFTEFAVTNKRVIFKKGFIMRKTVELNLTKVEGLAVDQGIIGRLFGYGTVTIHGIGGAKTPFKLISEPLNIRMVLNTELEKV